MVTPIRIYVEGGGDYEGTKTEFRKGFHAFLEQLQRWVGSEFRNPKVLPCGGRDLTYKSFRHALEDHPDACNILLVDTEGPVTGKPREHLQATKGWQFPPDTDDNCHLMVQAMEAWLVADREALKRFYGLGFNENAIPRRQNVEEIPKPELENCLQDAAQHTTKKEYHKTRHAPKILALLDASVVRKAAPHCDRLFTTLQAVIEST